MKTVTVTFPIKEAVEAMRLLRGESRCLIEQNEFLSDHDLNQRANLVMSARERICTALEEIADLEDKPADPMQMAINIAGRPEHKAQQFVDCQLKNQLNNLSGVETEPEAVQEAEFEEVTGNGGWGNRFRNMGRNLRRQGDLYDDDNFHSNDKFPRW